MYIYISIYRYMYFGPAVRVFANGPGDLGSIPGRVIPKTLKWYLIPPCLTLSIIRYGSRVKWSNPGKGVAPPLHLGVVAIEKGALGSPSTMVANFIYIYIQIYILTFMNTYASCIYIYIYIYIYMHIICMNLEMLLYIYIYIYIYIYMCVCVCVCVCALS